MTRKPNRTTVSLALTLSPHAKAEALRRAQRAGMHVSQWFAALLDTTDEREVRRRPGANATAIAIEGSRLAATLRDVQRVGTSDEDAIIAEARTLLDRMTDVLARHAENYDAALDREAPIDDWRLAEAVDEEGDSR